MISVDRVLEDLEDFSRYPSTSERLVNEVSINQELSREEPEEVQ